MENMKKGYILCCDKSNNRKAVFPGDLSGKQIRINKQTNMSKHIL